jgi:hypothetical protein
MLQFIRDESRPCSCTAGCLLCNFTIHNDLARIYGDVVTELQHEDAPRNRHERRRNRALEKRRAA